MSVMTPFEVAAQLRAAEIRHRWTERNPPPPLHLPARERRRAWAEYRTRWAESWEFGECCEEMARSGPLEASDPRLAVLTLGEA